MKNLIFRWFVLLTLAAWCIFPASTGAQNAWINEIHYDNAGADVNEAVEVVIEDPQDYNLSDFILYLFDGATGSTYYSIGLQYFQVGSTYRNYRVYYVFFPTVPGMQDGSPDGLALFYSGNHIIGQFLSYEGVFMGSELSVGGEDSEDIGISEDPNTPVGYSLQLGGTGLEYSSFSWQAASSSSLGTMNTNQLLDFMLGGIGIGTSSPDSSASLEIHSHSKGFLPPRLTSSEMQAIVSPAEGLMVYNTTLRSLFIFDGNGWAIAGNQGGTSCGDIQYGGITYHTVLIGTQCWMKENLNFGTFISSTVDQTNNDVPEKYCYNNEEINCTALGGLYQWDEMIDYWNSGGERGLCPPGFHVPGWDEYYDLVMQLGGYDLAGGHMKESVSLYWNPPNYGASNSSGFSARGAGWYDEGTFHDINAFGNLWVNQREEILPGVFTYGYYYLSYNSTGTGDMMINDEDASYAFSVRCVKD